MKSVLIAGGSGMIGSKLVKKLKQKNINIVLLSTKTNYKSLTNSIYWNPDQKIFPEIDLSQFDTCINLCGAGIFDKNFTPERKKTLYDSRIYPLDFLHEQFLKANVKLKCFISGSATGIYPNICLNELNENSTYGEGFIPQLVKSWEESALKFSTLSEQTIILRTGIVFSDSGGFVQQLSRPIKYFAGAIPGSGKQHVSWIHVDDWVDLLIHLAENKQQGIFNAVAPQPETLDNISRYIAKRLNRPTTMPHLPIWLLKLIFGKERHELLLTDQKISALKSLNTGFKFQFPNHQSALNDIIQ